MLAIHCKQRNIKYKETLKNKGIQHIIPRFYLEYFCYNTTNKVTVYSKKKVPHQSTPYKIAKQRKFYSLEKVPEYHKDLADEILTIIENGIKETHQQLVECDLNITSVKKINYATFIWFLFCRTRTFREITKERYFKKMNKMIGELANNKVKFSEVLKNKFTEKEIEKVRSIALNNKIHEHVKMEIDKDTLIYAMAKTGSNKKNIDILSNMKWTIIVTTQKYPFIASDHPVAIFNSKNNLDLSQQDASITMPLSNKMCLMLSWQSSLSVIHPYNVRNHSQIVTNINKRTLDWAYEEAYVGLTNEFTQDLLKEFGFIIQ